VCNPIPNKRFVIMVDPGMNRGGYIDSDIAPIRWLDVFDGEVDWEDFSDSDVESSSPATSWRKKWSLWKKDDEEEPEIECKTPSRYENSCASPMSFKFSLETAHPSRARARYRPMMKPKLPGAAQEIFQSLRVIPRHNTPIEKCKYAGRALAEWQSVVAEYESFTTARRMEGLPRQQQVEIPSLVVESPKYFAAG